MKMDDEIKQNGYVKDAKHKGDYVFHATREQKARSRLGSLDEFWRMHRKSLEEPDIFWTEAAAPFHWETPLPEKNIANYNIDVNKGKVFIEWMKGATTNICYNALDRNVKLGHGDKIAFYWEGNDPEDFDQITYKELLRRVCKFANVLKSKGVKKGDMVALYMPMILELAIAMFACARIGAVHSVVFGGYSAESLAERILDGNCRVLVTADGVWRGTKLVHLKNIVDKTVQICKNKSHSLNAVIVVQHQLNLKSTKRMLGRLTNGNRKIINGFDIEVSWNPETDLWWHQEMEKAIEVCDPVWVDAEDILFTLYTSGSTGKPKGCVHTTGAYMVYGALSFKYVFDFWPGDIFFCTGDIGWLTGHTYIVYGSLLNAATCIIYEGIPTHPNAGRYWSIVEKYKVTQFYTAPTAIRTLMRYDDAHVTRYNRSSLRVLASVGEPINQDAWFWYHELVGEGRCPIVDTFWQTETGGHLLTPIPFCTPLRPGCASLPFFGVEPAILDDNGQEIEGPGKGYLVIKRPWPAIMRTVYGNQERFENTYFRQFPGYYFTGDGCRRDEDGFYWVTGRMDDMLNVSGHLLSTMEVEAALLHHPAVAEAAVVPHPHPVKGECLYCFIVLKDGNAFDEKNIEDLRQQESPAEALPALLVTEKGSYFLFHEMASMGCPVLPTMKNKIMVQRIGPFASPEYLHPASALPKTRSGKTVRRMLRKIAIGDRDIGDLSALIDESVIRDLFESKKAAKRIPPRTAPAPPNGR